MLNGDVRPSTVEGVKRLAAQIKKERGIKHSAALDAASKAAQCQNYTHARRVLPAGHWSVREHRLFLTAYWYDQKSYAIGRETLEIALSNPLLSICAKAEFKRVRGFGSLRLAAPDHFVDDMLAGSQDAAHRRIRTAERSLRFMELTGLRPSADNKAEYPDGTADSRLPGVDHATDWVDPATGQYILIDEPYAGVPNEAARAAWASRYGWHLRKASWPGMYYPGQCDLYVATDAKSGYDLERLMARIDGMPLPTEDDGWNGRSSTSHEPFVSPAARTAQDRRRARSRGTVVPRPTATTIPYSGMFGSQQRRPAGTMPVDDHIEAGRIIKAALHSAHRPGGARRRLDKLRSTLEDWLALEVGRGGLAGPEFFDVYYHDPDEDGPCAEAAKSRSGLVDMLGQLRLKLQAAYPDCAPLREQLRRLDLSVSLIKGMKPAPVEAKRRSARTPAS